MGLNFKNKPEKGEKKNKGNAVNKGKGKGSTLFGKKEDNQREVFVDSPEVNENDVEVGTGEPVQQKKNFFNLNSDSQGEERTQGDSTQVEKSEPPKQQPPKQQPPKQQPPRQQPPKQQPPKQVVKNEPKKPLPDKKTGRGGVSSKGSTGKHQSKTQVTSKKQPKKGFVIPEHDARKLMTMQVVKDTEKALAYTEGFYQDYGKSYSDKLKNYDDVMAQETPVEEHVEMELITQIDFGTSQVASTTQEEPVKEVTTVEPKVAVVIPTPVVPPVEATVTSLDFGIPPLPETVEPEPVKEELVLEEEDVVETPVEVPVEEEVVELPVKTEAQAFMGSIDFTPDETVSLEEMQALREQNNMNENDVEEEQVVEGLNLEQEKVEPIETTEVPVEAPPVEENKENTFTLNYGENDKPDSKPSGNEEEVIEDDVGLVLGSATPSPQITARKSIDVTKEKIEKEQGAEVSDKFDFTNPVEENDRLDVLYHSDAVSKKVTDFKSALDILGG